ncbi:hypothetical protein R6Q59_012932 [Mikania micrantha]
MAESYKHQNQQLQQQQQQASGSSRLGQIVEVQGGHIVRSTSRKDRHSKVCTAKGPRDRRVRLSAHTAIKFYDVQDRLGYDRPSKAVDWLIKKAKSAIDKLAELPPWKPTATTVTSNFEQNNPGQLNHFDNIVDNTIRHSQNSGFFPMGASSNPATQSFPPVDLISRTSNRSQDLRLSLQSFQDPNLQNHRHHHQQSQQATDNNNVYFDGSGWPENQPGGFQRTMAWGGGDGVSGGYVFSSPAPAPFLQPLFGQTLTSELFSNREPLQSSTTPSFRAWIDPLPPFTGVAIDPHPNLAYHRPFSGFRVPTRIQGEEQEHDGISDRPSSASSDSRH